MSQFIQGFVFLVLTTLVGLRPLVTESYEHMIGGPASAITGIGDPTPLRTTIFDAAILGSFVAWLIMRMRNRDDPYRFTGLELGAAIVAVASILSCLFAGNKRLAINASADWICLPILTFTLVQVMRSDWQRRFLLAVLIATASVQALRCFEQYYYSFEETRTYYESIKTGMWAAQGVALDSPEVELFERRMSANQASGFFAHSNVAASYLVLCGMMALGLVFDRRRTNTFPWYVRALRFGFALFILGAVILTKSMGAWVAAVVGLFVWGLIHHFGDWIDRHRRLTYFLGAFGFMIAISAGLGHGLYHKSLPGASLNFRWQYWTNSVPLIVDHWLAGVGRENFGRHYLQYKPIESPEEIANPHNLFVHAAAELGLPGLIGVVVMMAGALLIHVRKTDHSITEIQSAPHPPFLRTLSYTLAVGIVILWGQRLLLGTNDPNLLYYTTMTTGLTGIIAFVVFLYAPEEATSRLRQKPSQATLAVTIGVLAFVIHEMINFAAFIPASATTLFAALAIIVPEAPSRKSTTTRRRVSAWMSVGITSIIIVLFVWFGLWPVARCRQQLALAEQVSGGPFEEPLTAHPAILHFQQAALSDPLDPTPWVMQAAWLIHGPSPNVVAESALSLAIDAIREGIHRDPNSIRIRRLLLEAASAKARRIQKFADYQVAINAARSVVELYPNDPGGMILLADQLLAAGHELKFKEWIAEAIAMYERALVLDYGRPRWEIIRGLSVKQREWIESVIREARDGLQK